MVAAGYRAIESMRLEKGYRVWSSDITAEDNPYEAGLGFAVRLEKTMPFIGKEALIKAKRHGIARRLRPVLLENGDALTFGGEPVRANGQVAGRVTSGGYGYTIGKSIAYAYVPPECRPGSRVEVQVFGDWIPATVAADPLYDPKGERIRA
jgi:4-methylaminobutanoate oxidase (formaldehyde-forming)